MEASVWITALSSALGLCVLLARFQSILLPSSALKSRSDLRTKLLSNVGSNSVSVAESALVSVVVPARNEEANLPLLLNSLAALRLNCGYEVIVVDDESTDKTAAIVEEFAERFGAQKFVLVRGAARPPEWTGKNWACHQGYLRSSGKYILFTDADTTHEPGGLEFATKRLVSQNLSLLSATPYHRCETWWEKLLGPFHLFLFVSTAAFSKPRPGRVFAIGQFLLFERGAYENQGGHERIRETLCDDLALAEECMRSGGQYVVEAGRVLYRVRMYETFRDFIPGWRRIFRLGFKHAKVSSSIEMYFAIAALTAGMKFFASGVFEIAVMCASVAILGFVQRRFGEFSILGVILFPLSLVVFIWVSVLALTDVLFRRQYSWRGRDYVATVD